MIEKCKSCVARERRNMSNMETYDVCLLYQYPCDMITKCDYIVLKDIAQCAADVQPVDRWISVEDRLPEEIGYYLVVIGNEMLVSIDIAEYSENRWHKHDEVLYWQPLPDYPEPIKG